MKEVIKTIKNLRIEKGYSQEYMAHKIGVSQRAYSKLENGHTRMTVSRLNTIAVILEVQITELLG